MKIDYQNFLVDTKDPKNEHYLNDFYSWVLDIFACSGQSLKIDYKYYGFKNGKLIYSNQVVDSLPVVILGRWLYEGSGLFKEGQKVIDNNGDICTIIRWDTTYFKYIVDFGKDELGIIGNTWARCEKDLMPL